VFQSSDVLVLPSLSEGTPRVLVEARANGVPVIASNVGGIPTSVQDSVDGILVPPKDAEAIARAIESLVSNKEVRESLIREGYRRVEKLTVEEFGSKIVDICLGGR
jgi:glycosyltransferase involved in cell wall biosynthesis